VAGSVSTAKAADAPGPIIDAIPSHTMSAGGELGVRIKLERARRHAEELDRTSQEYLQSDPFTIVESHEAHTGDLVSFAMVKRPIPAELGAIIGDVVHNLCCALDHLAWQLVLTNGNAPHKKTTFPYAQNSREFRKEAAFRLQGASATAIDLVKRMQVHPNGDADLFRVCRLDVEDKHRLLIPLGMAHESVEVLHVRITTPEDAPPEFPVLSRAPFNRQYPLEDGAEIFRVPKSAREAGYDMSERVYTFALGFGGGNLFDGEPIIPTVPKLVDHVERVTAPLVALI
jgi:hypothetical protein